MPFFVNTEYRGKGFARPSGDVPPPIKKRSEYGLAWAKFIYGSHMDGVTGIPYNWGTRINNLRLYAAGRQPANLYKRWFAENILNNPNEVSAVDNTTDQMDQVAKSRKHYMDVDFNQIFSPAPKYLNYLIGKFSKIELSPVVRALDERSSGEREKKKWKLWSKKYTQQDFQEVDSIRGMQPEQPEYVPENLDELEMFEQMGYFKMGYEVAMEKALAFTSQISKEHELRKKLIRDVATANVMAYMDIVDTDGIVKYQYVEPNNLIIEFGDKNVFDSASYFGTVVGYRISDIRKHFPKLSELEIESLARKFVGAYSNPNQFNSSYNELTGVYGYDEFNIPVLQFGFVTIDSIYFQNRTTKAGDVIRAPVGFNDDGSLRVRKNNASDLTKMFSETVYTGKWIIGTEHVFDYGKMNDIPYDSRGRRARLPIHVCKIEGKSIVEQMVPILDQVQMTYLRLQNAIAKAAPAGLKIDIGKMKKLHMHGKKWGPRDLIRLYSQTGDLLYDSTVSEGQMDPGLRSSDPGKAIEELRGGLGSALQDAIQSFEFCFSSLSEMTGIDRASVVSAQPERTSAAQTKIAAAGSSDALFAIIDGIVDILRDGAQTAALRIQSRCILDDTPYIDVIGRELVEAIKIAGAVPPVYYGVDITVQPTDEDKAEIMSAAQGAVKSGVITFSQYLFIKDCMNSGGGLNYASVYLAYLEAKAAKSQQQAALANQQADTQKQVELENQKTESKSNLAMIEGKIQMDIITHQTNEDIRKARELSGIPTPQAPQQQAPPMGQPPINSPEPLPVAQ